MTIQSRPNRTTSPLTMPFVTMANNNELKRIHQHVIMNGGNTDEDQQELIEILGGIDTILAFFMVQGGLNRVQLHQIKTILKQKKLIIPPPIEGMDDMLDLASN